MATASGAGRTKADDVTTEDLKADIERLKKDIAALTKQLHATGEHSVSAAKRAASESVEHLKQQGEATLADLKMGARDLEAQLTETVREKPVTALAIAAGVGYLLALLSRR